jgi:hypothetical protein
LNSNSTEDKWHLKLLKKYWKFAHHFHYLWLQCWQKVASESTLWGGQDCCHIVLLFIGLMFEFQSCPYYEGFSQRFLQIMVDQNPKKSNAKKL